MQNDPCRLTEEQRKALMQALAGGKRKQSDQLAAGLNEISDTVGDENKGGWITPLFAAAGNLLTLAAGIAFFDMLLADRSFWISIIFTLLLWAIYGLNGVTNRKVYAVTYGVSGILLFGSLFFAKMTGLPAFSVTLAAYAAAALAGVIGYCVLSHRKLSESIDPYCCLRDGKYTCKEITVRSKDLEEGRFPVVTDSSGDTYSCPFPADFESAARGVRMIGIKTYCGDCFAISTEEAGLSPEAFQMPADPYQIPTETEQLPPDQNQSSAF